MSNIVPALLEHPPLGSGWIPDRVLQADQVVLFVVDGLGWNQLADRSELAPTLSSSEGRAITTVAPTTTASALTSIVTGASPGEHGIVGYKLRVGGETLNVLRWTTERGDARETVVPGEMQTLAPFGRRAPVVISRAEFERSGFTRAHLEGVRFTPYGTVSTLMFEISEAVRAGESFVYAYYDGLDRVGHERGHGPAFDAEYRFVDRLVAEIRSQLPPDVALVVTADHGQVHTGDAIVPLADAVMKHTLAISGEARFVWLHGAPGRSEVLLASAVAEHGDDAWVLSVDEIVDRGLLGAHVTHDARARLGDVALIVRSNAALVDPQAPPSRLVGRHGSLTADEMYVPLLCPV